MSARSHQKMSAFFVTIAFALSMAAVLACPAPVHARSVGLAQQAKRPDRNYANFRVGASGATNRAELCLELSPHEKIAFDWCGTGATVLHNDDAPDMMHMRVLYRIASYRTPIGYLQPRLGAGIAELAVAADEPGFDFTGTGPGGVETAGPELTASLRLLTPIYKGVELLTSIDATAAYFAHAPELLSPRAKFQPGLTLSFGFGF